MLVLSRRTHEEIVINNDIIISIIEINGGNVKIGITAPKNISVNRREIQDLKDVAKLLTAEEREDFFIERKMEQLKIKNGGVL
jgi:carbon storage regulator CsrA